MQKITESRTETPEKAVRSGCPVRRCEQCGYDVSDMMVTNCPRCWSRLPKISCAGCTGCGGR